MLDGYAVGPSLVSHTLQFECFWSILHNISTSFFHFLSGGTVGSGVFVLTGLIAREYTGPGVVISWLIAGFGCCFSAMSYAELSCRYVQYLLLDKTKNEYLVYILDYSVT